MIAITTTEKWLEFSSMNNPIKAADSDKIFLTLELNKRGEVTIGFDFGKVIEGQFHPNPHLGETLKARVSKTDEEIKNYSYSQLHEDAKAFLEGDCVDQATFEIV